MDRETFLKLPTKQTNYFLNPKNKSCPMDLKDDLKRVETFLNCEPIDILFLINPKLNIAALHLTFEDSIRVVGIMYGNKIDLSFDFNYQLI